MLTFLLVEEQLSWCRWNKIRIKDYFDEKIQSMFLTVELSFDSSSFVTVTDPTMYMSTSGSIARADLIPEAGGATRSKQKQKTNYGPMCVPISKLHADCAPATRSWNDLLRSSGANSSRSSKIWSKLTMEPDWSLWWVSPMESLLCFRECGPLKSLSAVSIVPCPNNNFALACHLPTNKPKSSMPLSSPYNINKLLISSALATTKSVLKCFC